jgi:hypothetical protein
VTEPDALLLAVLTGLGFGFIIVLMGSSWQRLAVILTALFILQTGSQQLLRIIEGDQGMGELLTITVYRVAFAVAACIMVAVAPWLYRRSS